jgi:hypothetical protein
MIKLRFLLIHIWSLQYHDGFPFWIWNVSWLAAWSVRALDHRQVRSWYRQESDLCSMWDNTEQPHEMIRLGQCTRCARYKLLYFLVTEIQFSAIAGGRETKRITGSIRHYVQFTTVLPFFWDAVYYYLRKEDRWFYFYFIFRTGTSYVL